MAPLPTPDPQSGFNVTATGSRNALCTQLGERLSHHRGNGQFFFLFHWNLNVCRSGAEPRAPGPSEVQPCAGYVVVTKSLCCLSCLSGHLFVSLPTSSPGCEAMNSRG